MTEFASGMCVIIRDEEWMIKKLEKNTMGVQALHCIGISPLVKDRNISLARLGNHKSSFKFRYYWIPRDFGSL